MQPLWNPVQWPLHQPLEPLEPLEPLAVGLQPVEGERATEAAELQSDGEDEAVSELRLTSCPPELLTT